MLFPSARAGLHPLLRVAQFTSSPSAQAGASLSPRAEQPILLTMEVNREMAKTSHVKEEGDRINRINRIKSRMPDKQSTCIIHSLK